MLRKTQVTLTAVAALGLGSAAMAARPAGALHTASGVSACRAYACLAVVRGSVADAF